MKKKSKLEILLFLIFFFFHHIDKKPKKMTTHLAKANFICQSRKIFLFKNRLVQKI